LRRSRDNFTLERAGRALALCGAAEEGSRLSADLASRFSSATLTRQLQPPIIDAARALDARDPRRSLAVLDPVRPSDRSRGAAFWPAYLRGQAYLAVGDGAEAVHQFQTIVDRRGETPDSVLLPLSRLGLARASTLCRQHPERTRPLRRVLRGLARRGFGSAAGARGARGVRPPPLIPDPAHVSCTLQKADPG